MAFTSDCSVCVHEKRDEIDRALVAGEPLRSIAGRTGTSKSALDRHKSAHLVAVQQVAIEVAQAAVPPVPRPRMAGGSLADEAKALRDRAMALLVQVERGIPLVQRDDKPGKEGDESPSPGLMVIDFKAGATLIGQARGCLELEAKLLGELQTGTTVNIVQHPDVQRLFRVLIEALADEPSALVKVMGAIEAETHGGGGSRPALTG